MPETPSAGRERPVRQVCDTCHLRKVRCDRTDPCGNCEDSNVACTRSRYVKRAARPHVAGPELVATVRSLSERMADLERLVSSSDPVVPSDAEHRSWIADGTSRISENSTPSIVYREPVSLRSRSQAENRELSLAQTFISSRLQRRRSSIDIQRIIECQLAQMQGLVTDGHRILESAVRLENQLSDVSIELPLSQSLDEDPSELPQVKQFPSAEFLSSMLRDLENERFGPYVRDFFRHISIDSLKRMGLALLRNTVFGEESIIYTVCVNSIAYKFLTTAINANEVEDMAEDLWHSTLGYKSAALAASMKLPFSSTPSLSLLQGVLCAVFLHQGSGSTALCMKLIRVACRICAELDLGTAIVQGQCDSQEAYYCFSWCYMLEKNYCMKMGDQNCLIGTDFEVDARLSLLQNSPPMADLLSIYLELAKSQNAIIPYMRDGKVSSTPRPSINLPPNVTEILLRRINYLRDYIQRIRSPSALWKGLNFESEMSALDFACHSTTTAILSAIQVNPEPILSTGDSYLDSARQELLALVSMCLSAKSTGHMQVSVSFLHWTLLFYPITSYFIVFCNVMATSHFGDYQLLVVITDSLMSDSTVSPSIAKVQSLFKAFVSLSRALLQNVVASTAVLPGRGGTVQLSEEVYEQQIQQQQTGYHLLNTSYDSTQTMAVASSNATVSDEAGTFSAGSRMEMMSASDINFPMYNVHLLGEYQSLQGSDYTIPGNDGINDFIYGPAGFQ